MDTTRPAAASDAASPAAQPPAQLAKAALRRLATAKLEPTPENYARAYQIEAGDTAAPAALPERAQRLVERLAARALDADAGEFTQAMAQGRWDAAERALDGRPAADASELATLIERIVRGVERGGRNWTTGRKKDSLQRVLSGSRSDAKRLQQRLSQLLAGWESDAADSAVAEDGEVLVGEPSAVCEPDAMPAGAPLAWERVTTTLGGTVREALPLQEATGRELAEELEALERRIAAEQATPALADALEDLCRRAERVLQHRHHLLAQLGGLCVELTESLTDLAENDSWVRGQCDAMRLKIEEGLTARGVRSVSEALRSTRERQGVLRLERERARDALKSMINLMLSELGELGQQTGRFHESVGRYAGVIEQADSLESLAGVVREMVEESRTVHGLVQQTQARLQSEHAKATGLTQRVVELEGELRRLSDEVSTDQLTQIANRRGLLQAFEVERARLERGAAALAVGLLDIDNFKRLNDEHGHSVGDEALKSLAEKVRSTLRPTDIVARYGGEEFVVLLPETPADEAQQILTRLQRSLSGGLFMHDQKPLFVTFSAGVTAYRSEERIEDALERADQALYEAKRTGKNRTVIG